jgi:carbonic anhydrase
MSITDELPANNARYAESFTGPLPLPPAKHVAVVACMDARINVYGVLGLAEGEAHVIRNAGGVITEDKIRSLAISQRLLGTREIILIHHTDCGMLTFTTTTSRSRSRTTSASSRRGPPRRSRTWKPMCANRSRGSRPARSSRTPTRCAASSSTWPPGKLNEVA